ncbi:thioesterase domain-containing protein [Streptomyces sp. NPDC001904]|uniref:thioesterase II family protein n=1 Tax=Streptomyces sp. NPDC001904 TaxID=3154531 RepID=UPI00332D5A2F
MDMRLFCFGHAGAGASGFGRWQHHCGPGVDVVPMTLPGRAGRRREPRATSRDALLEDLFAPLAAAAARGPYALYGHSLGALVAHALTRALLEAGLPAPKLLAVGACHAPHTTAPAVPRAQAGDAGVLEFAAAAGAAPRGVLAAPTGLWHRTVLPVLRDDLALARALRTAAAADRPRALPVLLLAVGGAHDPLVDAAALDGWRAWTRHPPARRTLPGDHFFQRTPAAPRLIGRACRVAERLHARTPAPAPRPARPVPAASPAPAGTPLPGPSPTPFPTSSPTSSATSSATFFPTRTERPWTA